MRHCSFERRLANILAEDVGGGSFSRPGIDAQGKQCTHHFSWASGMASMMWESKYQKRLRCEVPAWTAMCNPYHVSRMCEEAIRARRRLPGRLPVKGETE